MPHIWTKPEDAEFFTTGLRLANALGVKPDPDRLIIYREELDGEMSGAAAIACMTACLRTCKFFPTIAEVIAQRTQSVAHLQAEVEQAPARRAKLAEAGTEMSVFMLKAPDRRAVEKAAAVRMLGDGR